jgi:RNA polymerase-binding transcription factor DksA
VVADVLAAERRRVLEQIDALASDHADIIAAQDLVATDDEHDPEGATIAFERSRVGTLLEQARDHLAAIDHAEQRLRDGVLDACERCGSAIAPARRAARPTATTCIACASINRR